MNPADEMIMWTRHALHHRRMFWRYRAWVRLGHWARRDAKECRWHRDYAWWALSMAKDARARITQAERIAA